MNVRPSKGFTLLEMLIVILLISLSLGLLGFINPDSGARQAQRELERFNNLLQLLRKQAVLTDSDYSIRVEQQSYQVEQLHDHHRWEPASQFQTRVLPAAVQLSLQSLDRPIGQDAPNTRLLVLSSNEVSPFSLILSYQHTALLKLSSDGIQDAQIETLQ
ncbi:MULTISPECIES: type II secretion system minor pseudopilin GspH [Pseudomonas]|uniref:type II secretion system minor pseudopilin GspH n=1 Tax=Pseudomonas TaxID=286 RepID=UPI00099C1702|nr:type II secretion system minor pseudopilin GspH [Pseudomonas synxantha]VCU67852.1 Type II secretion system protein H [Pseudomonas synxantha]